MTELDPARVLSAINRLQIAEPEVFGAIEHRFALNTPLSERDVRNFENQHNIALPPDYRLFVTQIGNGGAGPFYGIFPLGQMDDLHDSLESWHESNGFVGKLSQRFSLLDTWNDTIKMPVAELAEIDEHEYERQFEEFERVYWDSSLVNGAIPICHEGCAIRIWLAVSGPQAGYLWRDRRADYKGMMPLLLGDGRRATFGTWYNEWLDEALSKSEEKRARRDRIK